MYLHLIFIVDTSYLKIRMQVEADVKQVRGFTSLSSK